MTDLVYCLNSAFEAGEKRRPAKVINDLGITCRNWHTATMADLIILYGAENIPEVLPPYIKVRQK